MENIDELNELKQQWAALQQKLGDQQDMNKKLLRRAVRSKMYYISRFMWVFTAFGFLVSLPAVYLLYEFGLKKEICIYTGVGLIISLIIHVYNSIIIPNPYRTNVSISQILSDMTFFRKVYLGNVIYGLFFLLGLFVWTFISGFEGAEASDLTRGFITGGTIGIVIAMFLNKKVMRQVAEIKEDLNALKEFER